MEKLRLRAFLTGNKLHIVDQQHVNGSIALAKIDNAIVPHRIDHLVHEALGRDVRQLQVAVVPQNILTDRVHQMRFAEPHAAIDKQRVVRSRGRLGNRTAGGMGELVRRAHDESVEGVARIEPGGARSRDIDGAGLERCRFLRSELHCRIIRRRVREKMHGQIRTLQLAHRFADHARVVFCQPVFEQAVRDADCHRRPIVRHERRRPEPGVKAVPVDLGFDARKDFFPEVHWLPKNRVR